ncbi:hypothetical protein LTR86_000256 [Recurvomyces mirabilis]|nr:hypothetical protein LTR86_000256 [Recurvomyces mirabilis]
MDQIWRQAQETQDYKRLAMENDLLQACFVLAQTPSESSQQQESRSQKVWGAFASDLRTAVRNNGLLYPALDPLHALSQLEYFQRIWILQETGRARSLTFHYGSLQATHRQVLLSLSLARAAWAFNKGQQLQHTDIFDERFMKCMTARTTCINGLPLVDVLKFSYLERSSMHNATDPRDLVYALLGLAKSQHGIKVDYNASVEQVYVWTARFLLEQGFTDLLVRFKSYSSSKGLASDKLPSWAHDWSTRSLPFFTRFRAAKDTQQQLSFVAAPSSAFGLGLTIKGNTIGRVTALGNQFSISATSAGFSPRVIGSGQLRSNGKIPLSADDKRVLSARLAQLHHHSQAHIEDARTQTLLEEPNVPLASFWCWWLEWMQSLTRLLGTSDSDDCINQYNLDTVGMLLREVPQRLRNNRVFTELATSTVTRLMNPDTWLQRILPPAPGHPGGRLTPTGIELAESMFRSAWCTRLLALAGGIICSAPEATQLDDVVITCRGVNAPLVVRRHDSGAYSIIGPAYVCGAMEGQMLGTTLSETRYTLI